MLDSMPLLLPSFPILVPTTSASEVPSYNLTGVCFGVIISSSSLHFGGRLEGGLGEEDRKREMGRERERVSMIPVRKRTDVWGSVVLRREEDGDGRAGEGILGMGERLWRYMKKGRGRVSLERVDGHDGRG